MISSIARPSSKDVGAATKAKNVAIKVKVEVEVNLKETI